MISPTQTPTPEMIRLAREACGMNQSDAAQLVGLGSFKRWSEYENGHRSMDAARWMLFLLLTHQHPSLSVQERAPS